MSTTSARKAITVSTVVAAPVATVWEKWNNPRDIMNWCHASDDWHAPAASNDLREGGRLSTTMAAKDGSFSFEFGGIYDLVEEHRSIAYTLGDGRKVRISFEEQDGKTLVTEIFDAEDTHPLEMQQQGWQAILDNFRKYTETSAG